MYFINFVYKQTQFIHGFYVDFRNCHPNHVFSSIVYSQALRIRRIVNDQTRFEKHLNDLSVDFKNSNYPSKLVSNIIDKVRSLPRNLEPTNNNLNDVVDSELDTIRIVSTFGCDQVLVKTFESVSKLVPFKFDYVKKTGASLEKLLCKSKHISTGPKYGKSTRCIRTKCKSCMYMSEKDSIIGSSGKSFKTASGTCSSKNVIYAASCKLCSKVYAGKTTQMLCGRISKHKSYFHKYRKANGKIQSPDGEELDDEFALGVHLYNQHKIKEPNGFENSYVFTILEHCSPKSLSEKEHLWIQQLRCLYPLGLNLNSPLGFPLLLS